ncbi:hypothetical protein GQR58_023958 [Nymphon striatum]|nr:hypothetical protein GQR58_023958 [Nymphon striatum]
MGNCTTGHCTCKRNDLSCSHSCQCGDRCDNLHNHDFEEESEDDEDSCIVEFWRSALDNEIGALTRQATKIKISIDEEGMRRILSSGLTESQLGMIQPPSHLTSTLEIINHFPECFDGIGCFREDAVHDPPRRCPLHLQSKVEADLDTMESQDAILMKERRSKKCASITYATKKTEALGYVWIQE